jgi:hypothetical protein
LAPGADPPTDLPWVVDYLTYRWDGKEWLKSIRTVRNAHWSDDEAWPNEEVWPNEAAFPTPSDQPRTP